MASDINLSFTINQYIINVIFMCSHRKMCIINKLINLRIYIFKIFFLKYYILVSRYCSGLYIILDIQNDYYLQRIVLNSFNDFDTEHGKQKIYILICGIGK